MGREDSSSGLMKINEAAKYLGVTRRWVYRRIWSGDLSASKVGGFYFIRKEDLDALIEHGTTKEHPQEDATAVLPLLKCGYCFRILESDSLVGGVCEAQDCEQLICMQDWSNGMRRCVQHSENREQAWERALADYREGRATLLVRSSQARLREIDFMQRLQARLSTISSLRHPVTDEVLTVKDWDAIKQDGDDRAELMRLMNKAVLGRDLLAEMPMNVYARYRVATAGPKGQKGTSLTILAKAVSRPIPMLQHGFDSRPLGMDELGAYLVQVGNEAEREREYTLALLASATGWDESARTLIRGSGVGTAFSHRWMLAYLSDLESHELIYNPADPRSRAYVELFNPLSAGEEAEEVARAVEKEMGIYSSFTLQLALESMPYPASSIDRAFRKLAESGRYVMTEVEGIGPAIVRS
jgi:excisionase family DNA binding protein